MKWSWVELICRRENVTGGNENTPHCFSVYHSCLIHIFIHSSPNIYDQRTTKSYLITNEKDHLSRYKCCPPPLLFFFFLLCFYPSNFRPCYLEVKKTSVSTGVTMTAMTMTHELFNGSHGSWGTQIRFTRHNQLPKVKMWWFENQAQ